MFSHFVTQKIIYKASLQTIVSLFTTKTQYATLTEEVKETMLSSGLTSNLGLT